MRKGIDVSNVPSWQRYITVEDWKQIKAAGYTFAILKAGGSDDGYYKDAVFEKNYENAKAAGMEIGAYYIVGAACNTTAEGKNCAEKFAQILKGKQFEYPVYIDVEHPAAATRKGNTDAVVAFCQAMQAAGYWAGVYASMVSGFESKLDDSRLQGYAHWVAQYASKCDYKGKVGIGIWQWTETGRVPGINGNVDVNNAYVDYPAKIKAKGLNGFQKASSAATGGSGTAASSQTANTSAGTETASTRAAAVSLADSYIGCVRGDSKHKQIIDIFNTVQPDGWPMNYTAAWCATFVSAIAIKQFGKTKAKELFPLSANCAGIIRGARAKGIWEENDAYVPSPGDWILYDWDDNGIGDDTTGYDHVGMVKSVSGGKITVIEGNRNDKCAYRVISVNGRYIRGFVVPKYPGATSGTSQATTSAAKANNTTAKPAKLTIDGDWGTLTTKALQYVVKTTQDGKISGQLLYCKRYLEACNTQSWEFVDSKAGGSPTIKALQKIVGSAQDGYAGQNTVKALQQYFNDEIRAGLIVDGYLGKLTAKAVQRWLNMNL